jgi:hypothetical protein
MAAKDERYQIFLSPSRFASRAFREGVGMRREEETKLHRDR